MKKNLIFLFVGILVGACASLACAPLFNKPNRMFFAKEDITVRLGTSIHIVNRDDERFFKRELVIPKGACLNDDGSCFDVRFLKLNLTLEDSEVPKYFKEGIIEGNYFMSHRIKE